MHVTPNGCIDSTSKFREIYASRDTSLKGVSARAVPFFLALSVEKTAPLI